MEEALLRDLDELLVRPLRHPELLALPVRVVVPSRALRLHLSERLVRHRGRAAAGIVVQTSFALALEVLERCGEAAPRGRPLFDMLVRRLARSVPALRKPLDGLADGYRAVSGSVRDLLDAGLEPALAGACLEALAPRSASRGGREERAEALIRTAVALEHAMEVLEVGRSSNLLRRARALLESQPETALPARAVLVHGFADATGVMTDLLETLVRQRGARVYLDRPPDPADAGGRAREEAFTERFAQRILGLSPAGAGEARGAGHAPALLPQLEIFEAPSPEAEVLEACRRLRRLLDGGARPETLALVARDLGRYRVPLRRHLEAQGIPFSALGTVGGLAPPALAARALLTLLRRGSEAATDHWLDTRRPGDPRSIELRLAFRAQGAGRLREAAAIRVNRFLSRGGKFPLPIRQGLRALEERAETEDGSEDGEARSETFAARRHLSGRQLKEAVEAAEALCRRLDRWPEKAPAGEHFRWLRELVREDLRWVAPPRGAAKAEARSPRPWEAVTDALAGAAREIPEALELSRGELLQVVEASLESVGRSRFGGLGGGVRVLSVTEARALTFEHLFLLGLNRDVFPRVVREDPLLPDELRLRLARVLPDIPVKGRGFDEERHLFAQLLSSSPRVTASRATADEEGRPLSPSPLLERAGRGIGKGREVTKAPPPFALPAPGQRDALRPPRDIALRAALHGGRDALRPLLPTVVEAAADPRTYGLVNERSPDSEPPFSFSIQPAELAQAQLRLLDEIEPDRTRREGRKTFQTPGPYLGFLGGVSQGDPRQRDLFVTHLEAFAACPWQTFLQKILRIEPTPDPLEALPALDALLVGRLVHRVLEHMVAGQTMPGHGDGAARSLTEALASRDAATPVHWSPPLELEMLLTREAELLLREAGVGLPGLVRALRDRARPFLEAVRERDWADGPVPVLGAELEGAVPLPGPEGKEREIRFRADRVDRRSGTGPDQRELLLTDYKTGKPISSARTAAKRREHFLKAVAEGKSLQAVAYRLAKGSGEGAVGRYFFARPDLDDELRDFSVTGSDDDFREAFELAARRILAAWDAGTFFPRLVEPRKDQEPSRCGYCLVAEACLRRDSGARQRLRELATRQRGGPDEPFPGSRPFARSWFLDEPAGGSKEPP